MSSRFCRRAEQSYTPIEGEAAAAAWAVYECKHLLLSLHKFTLAMDHKPLIGLLNNKSPEMVTSPRVMKQRDKLFPYPYEAVHTPGKANVIADMLLQQSDSPVSLATMTNPVSTTSTSQNVGPGYSATFGPPGRVYQNTGVLPGGLRKPPGP